MALKPIETFLTDFGDGAPAPLAAPAAPAVPPAPGPVPGAPPAANDAEDARARAFAAGKEEGLKLAAARHALERRKREAQEERRAAALVAEAEARIGEAFALRLGEEMDALGETLERAAAAALRPFVEEAARHRAVREAARHLADLAPLSRVALAGPPQLTEAFLRALPEALRGAVDVSESAAPDLCVSVDRTRLATRLGELREALAKALA